VKIVTFDLIKENNRILYPDEISNFSNGQIIGDKIYADYFGDMPLTEVGYFPSQAINLITKAELVSLTGGIVSPALFSEVEQLSREHSDTDVRKQLLDMYNYFSNILTSIELNSASFRQLMNGLYVLGVLTGEELTDVLDGLPIRGGEPLD
jgi:hypothetical protein